MKLKTVVLAALLSLSTSAFAQWFPGAVHVTVLPGQVVARVWNPNFAPIVCNGQVYGMTTFGQVFTTFFVEQLLPVGDFRLAYVNATTIAPFVNGWANIHCRYFW